VLRIKVFTSINTNYIDKAAVLWDSMKSNSYDLQINTFVIEPSLSRDESELLKNSFEHTSYPGKIHTLYDLPEDWAFILKNKSVMETCTAIKASAANFLLDAGTELVIYFDPDILLFSDLDNLILESSSNAFSLTPHLLVPPDDDDDGVFSNEINGSMKFGVFNLGFFAITNTIEAKKVLEWWNSRLLKYCEAKPELFIFADQKWFDLSPAYFPQIIPLRHPGYNVGPWNIESRHLTFSKEIYYSNGESLVFFHFSSYDKPDLLGMLEKFDKSKLSLQLLSFYGGLLAEKSSLKLGIISKNRAVTEPMVYLNSKAENIQVSFTNRVAKFLKILLPKWYKQFLRKFLSLLSKH
jgi:lipopolysaccharide biosynthesis glycosyltransferase